MKEELKNMTNKTSNERETSRRIIVPKGKFRAVCPYIDSMKYCKLTGTYQDGYHLQTYCLSQNGDWLRCANYESHAR